MCVLVYAAFEDSLIDVTLPSRIDWLAWRKVATDAVTLLKVFLNVIERGEGKKVRWHCCVSVRAWLQQGISNLEEACCRVDT